MWRGILQISSLIVKLQESLGILSIEKDSFNVRVLSDQRNIFSHDLWQVELFVKNSNIILV